MTGSVRQHDLADDFLQYLPKQEAFIDASYEYRYLLYGGARGGSKSTVLRRGSVERLVDWAQRGYSNVRVGLFCEDYPTLADRQISKIETEFPRWLGVLKTTRSNGLGFYLRSTWGGGIILLRNLDNPNKYIGAEMAGQAVDEITLHEISTFHTLRGSLRWPRIHDTYWWGATNPAGIGLVWVRALWIERDFERYPELIPLKDQFKFIQALPADNPFLTAEYWAELMAQPRHIREAWIEGNWYVLAGVAFEELRPGLHQFPPRPPLFGSSREIVMDWGYQHKAAAIWLETTRGEMPDGSVDLPRHYAYREHVVNKTVPIIFAEQVCQLSDGEGVKRASLDPAAWAQGQDGSPSPAEQMMPVLHANGISLRQATKGPGSRARGCVLLHTYLYPRKFGPLLRVSTSCKVLWEQLTTLMPNENDIEDTNPDQEDDAFAALRYWAQGRPAPPPPTPEEVLAMTEAYDVYSDPRSVQAAIDKAARMERLRRAFPAVMDQLPAKKPRFPRNPWDRRR